jgi:hypothetical protein
MMRFLRQSIGPLIVGLAAWCAAGTLAVASPASATSRVAALAPWWIAVGAFAVAFAVPRFRDSPWTATPALLSVVPWLPIPMTPALLIWTGPMAWAPVLLAFALAVGLAPLKALFRALNLFEPDDATVAAFVLTAVLGGCAAWAADVWTPGGDEPSYLLISTSLLKDGDIDLTNNYARRDYASFVGGVLAPDFRVRGLHGEIYSIHAPGVSALVAPVFQFFGYTGARGLIVLLTSLGAVLIWRLCWRATDSSEAAWFAWAAVVLTPTFAMQSFSVFPDGPALLAVAAGVLMIVQLARGSLPGWLPALLTGVGLAALPWLHTRFAVLAGGLGAAIALRLMSFSAPIQTRVSRLAALLVLPIVSALLWFYFFKALYGTYDPRVPYANEPQLVAWILPAMLGLFFDGQFGIAAYAPAVAGAFAGFVMKPLATSRRLVVEVGLIALVYLVAVTSVYMWWAGVPATPARFLMPILPILAVPLAVLWTRARAATRTLLAGLAGAGTVVTAGLLLVHRAEFMWETRKETTSWLEWLSPVSNLSRVWPGFFWNLPSASETPNTAFAIHAFIVVGTAALLWTLVSVVVRRRERPVELRFAAALWAIAVLTIISPISWAVTGARPLDPAPAQLDVIRAAGNDRGVVSIDAGRVSRLRSFSGRLTILPLERGEKNQPAALSWPDVPAGRYSLRVRSASGFPVRLRLMIARSAASWREFDLPGAGEFSFPFLLPSLVSNLWIDAGGSRPGLQIELAADAAVKDPGLPIRSAAQYPAAGVLFLDDMTYPERDGFWVRGQADAEFIVVPDNGAAPPATVRCLVRNGASQNQVSVESGTFQRLLVMSPGQEQELEIPVVAGGGVRVRVASGSGFVPSDKNPESADHRSLGVWIEIR